MVRHLNIAKWVPAASFVLGVTVLLGLVTYVFFMPYTYITTPTDISAEKERWQERVRIVGGESAYAEFAHAVRKLAPSGRHLTAHIFGNALFAEEGVSGLSVCDSRFLYGCFHELLSLAIIEHGIEIVPDLDDACTTSPHADAPLSCKHGLGHGLLAYFGYSKEALDDALTMCSRLDEDPIGACFEGVFMEYFLRFFSSADGSDALKSNPEKPYDVCIEYTGLPAQRCIGLLALWWRTAVFLDATDESSFTWMGARCSQLPPALIEYRYTCFRGIGFAIAVGARDVPAIETSCRAASLTDEDMLECLRYAAITVSNGVGVEAGVQLCKGLPESMRTTCEHYARTSKLI